MSLDRLCLLFCLGLLPITFLPSQFLWLGIAMGIGLGAWSLIKRDKFTLLMAVLLAFSYQQVVTVYQEASQVQMGKRSEMVKIVHIFKQNAVQRALGQTEKGEMIYLSWQSETPLVLNGLYQLEVNPRPISARLNQGNFDRQRWLFAHRVSWLSSVRKADLLRVEADVRGNWLAAVQVQIRKLSTQGLILALAFGERAWLEPSHWQLFQDTATAHLIAISGLHIALAFGIGFWFAKGIQWGILRFSPQHSLGRAYLIPRLIGLAFAVGYSFLAGFAVPTVRAIWAISLVLLCQLSRRHHTPWQLWLRVVSFLLVLDPLTLLSDSFWLSIGAVASLIFWYQHFPLALFMPAGFYKKLDKIARLLWGLVHLQVGIWLCFSPIQLFFFEGLSLFSLPANLLIVPLFSFLLVPLILFSLLTSNLLATWQIVDWLLQGSLWLLEKLSGQWMGLSLTVQWGLLSLNLLILGGIYALIHRDLKRGGQSLLLSLLFYCSQYLPSLWQSKPLLEWIHFDVGQGLAMGFVYQEGGLRKVVLYDTGASWEGGSMAEVEILPYLKRQGLELTAIILSHDDNDHSGGVKPLLKAYPKARLIQSGKMDYGKDSEPCLVGLAWQFGELKLQAIFPYQLAEMARNPDSCVLIGEVGDFRFLLTGDSTIKEEQEYADKVGKIDLLQVGHHGSNTSTGYTLLASTKPNRAIISTGRWNPWKMPNMQVIDRLAQNQVQVLNTAEVGMIRVSFFQRRYQLQTTRHRWRPWYSAYLSSVKRNE